ncbi:uncharacterized protein LOC143518939 [Brachyhypopomus gauderio]|uniref:uncharacterized protein LOC143518939 n=1 Tax=Brachyhypopomus gauderio TaxID=698409 RepID=UPI004040F288
MTDRSCSDHALVRARTLPLDAVLHRQGQHWCERHCCESRTAVCIPLPLLKPAVCCVKPNRHAGCCSTHDTQSVAAGGTVYASVVKAVEENGRLSSGGEGICICPLQLLEEFYSASSLQAYRETEKSSRFIEQLSHGPGQPEGVELAALHMAQRHCGIPAVCG